MSEKLEFVIGLLTDALDEPEAHDPDGHIRRSERVYGLLHLASEVLVLEVIPEAQAEGDVWRRIRPTQISPP